MALLSQAHIGLRRLIARCVQYFSDNDLQFNDIKSKTIVFEKHWKYRSWVFNRKAIQQGKTFKYFGLTFHYRLSWGPQQRTALKSAKRSIQGILHFFYTRGNSHIPVTLHIFKAKVAAQLLYGCTNLDLGSQRLKESFLIFYTRYLYYPIVFPMLHFVWRLASIGSNSQHGPD